MKKLENKTGDDSTETEKSDKAISKKISEPSSDKPNPKHMKITLPLSKSDEKSFQACLDYHMKMTELIGSLVRKKKKSTGTFSHCTSSNSRSR